MTAGAEIVLTASAATPRAVRAELRRWLGRLRWPSDEIDQLVFCVSEVVTNIVEHAYVDVGGTCGEQTVEVFARLETVADPRLGRRFRWVCVDVHDTGRWRDPDPPRRGLGLPLLCRLLESVVVITRGTPDYGTTVSLRSHPVELGPPGRPDSPGDGS